MPVVGIDFTAKVSSAIAEVNKLTNATRGDLAAARREAIKLVGEEERANLAAARSMMTLSRAQQAAHGTGTQLVGTNRALQGSTANLVNQFVDAGVMLQGGMSPMRTLVTQGPQAADALRQMVSAAGGFGAAVGAMAPFAPMIGAIAIAVGALGTAWWVAADAARDAEAATLAAAQAASEAQRRHSDIARVVREADDAVALAAGRVTKEDLKKRDAVDAVNAAYRAELDAQKKRIAAGEQAIAVAEKELRAAEAAGQARAGRTGGDGGASAAAMDRYRESVAAANLEIEDARGKLGAVASAMNVTIGKVNAATEAEDKGTKAKGRSKRATDEAREAERARREELARYIAEVERGQQREVSYAAGLEQIRAAGTDARLSTLDEGERIHAQAVQAVEDLRAQTAATLALAGSREQAVAALDAEGSAIAAIRAKEVSDLDAYYAEVDRKRTEDTKKAEDAARREADARKAAQREILSAVGSAAQSVTAITGDTLSSQMDMLARSQAYQAQAEEYLTAHQQAQLRERIAAQKKAAMAAFEANKAAQMASAVVNTASAVVAALDDAPWPYNLALAGLAGAAGAAEIATIASQRPAFHSGGVVTADLLPGEAVLTRRAVDEQGGRSGIDQMNAGAGTGGAIIVEYHHGHKVIDRAVSAVIRRGGRSRSDIRALQAMPGYR